MEHTVDREVLLTMISGLNSTGIDQEIDALELKVSTVLSSWSGEAQEAYATAQAAWTVQMRALTSVLSRAVAAATNAHDHYTEAYSKINRIP